jgi:hypothetical protein
MPNPALLNGRRNDADVPQTPQRALHRRKARSVYAVVVRKKDSHVIDSKNELFTKELSATATYLRATGSASAPRAEGLQRKVLFTSPCLRI